MFACVEEIGKFRFVFCFFSMTDVQFDLDGRAIYCLWLITKVTCSEKQSLRNCWDWEKDNRRDPCMCLWNRFPSIQALSESALVLHWVNASENLLSPQANIPTFICRLLSAYIGVPQGLVFGATLFLFYLPLKWHWTESKNTAAKTQVHTKKAGAGLAPKGRNSVCSARGWVCPHKQDPALLKGVET